jgi:hypothetical protein
MKFSNAVGMAMFLLLPSASAMSAGLKTCEEAVAYDAQVRANLDMTRYKAALNCHSGPKGNWTLSQRDAYEQRVEYERGYYRSGAENQTYGKKPYPDIADRHDDFPDSMTVDQADHFGRMDMNRAQSWAGCNALIDDPLLEAIMAYEGLASLRFNAAQCFRGEPGLVFTSKGD